MTDTEILRLIRESAEKGQRALFDEYYNYVCAVTARILRGCGSPEDIDECVTDIFTEVFLHLDHDKVSTLKAFIGTTAKNRAISLRRSLTAHNRKKVAMDDEGFPELPSDENIAANAERAAVTEKLLKEISALGEPDSVIIIQKYFYDRNSKEISAIVGLSPTAVRLRASRALRRLRKALKDLY